MIVRRVLAAVALVGSLGAAACGGPGTSKVEHTHHKFLILLCQASDLPDLPHDKAFYDKLFLDKTAGERNVYNYFVDQSYGNSDIDGTIIKDWLKTKKSQADLVALKDPAHPNYWRGPLSKACVEEFNATDDFKKTVKLSDYLDGGIVTIWNLEGADGGASGFNLDGVDYPSVNAGAGAKPWENSVSFFTHEMLHNLGLAHAHGAYPGDSQPLQFKADAHADHSFGTSTYEEYGDCWSIMGCGRWVLKTGPEWGDAGPGLGAAQRFRLGWLPGDRVYTWNGATTKITLAPINRPDIGGMLMVKIPVHAGPDGACCGYYTVEYQEKSGWDANLALDHGVLIHEVRVGAEAHTFLVGRSVYGAWLPGQVFTDTFNRVRISIDSYGDSAVLSFSATGLADDGLAKCDPPGYTDATSENQAPTVTMQSPLDGSHAVAGLPVTLRVSAVDPAIPSSPSAAPVPDSRLQWFVGPDPVGTGKTMTYTFASPGTYTVTAVAQDVYCLETVRRATVTVDPPAPASVVILEPVDKQEFLVGPTAWAASVTLKASASSSVKTFDWIDSGLAGYLGSGESTVAVIKLVNTAHNCVVEPHTITVRGKTATGEVVTATVTIILKTECIR